MTDPPLGMLGHIGLNLRLVFQCTPHQSDTMPRGCPAPVPDLEWRLSGLLPEDPVPGEAGHISAPIGLTLDRDEAEGYYLNLTSPQPSLFVLLRQQDVAAAMAVHPEGGVPEAAAVTASYTQAARWMDGGMAVVRTELPEPMLAWIAEFAQHHFPLEGKKKRGAFRPSFLSRREFGDVARRESRQSNRPTDTVPDRQRSDGS